MEHELCSTPLVMASQNCPVVEGITQNLVPKPLIYCNSFDLNNQNHIIEGIPILSGDKGEPTIDVHVDGRFVSPVSIVDSNSFVTSQGKTVVGIFSNHINNNEFEEHLAGGRPSNTPLAATRIGVHEYLGNSATFSPSVQALGPDIFSNWQDTSNHLLSTFGERGYGEVHCNSTNKWNVNKFPKALEVDGTELMAYSSIGNMVSNGWTSSSGANLANIASYHSSNCDKELSLSLTRSPTVRSGLKQPSCSSKELHKSLGSNKHIWFSPETLGSRFRAGIQEIFAQIATYSFENLEGIDCSAAGVRAGEGSKSNSAFTLKRKVAINQNGNSMFEAHVESSLQRNAAESNKSQLLMLLQLVDNRYSECLDEIHTVASAFHAATELDPQMHAHFALGTISLLYKDLRERISNHILAMGSSFNGSRSEEEKEWCIGTSFIRKQWVLQQVKRKDQLWRPQRGLPERSVSVLRAWMFQNFLHPYPKDAEKHLLAVKSGLTRSQVSNWFINARVRLWKPMIEEMHAELNRRKDCRNEEGLESTNKRRLSMNNQMLNTN